ncbi:MAG TPA: hypothetical protein VFD58_22605 [Blastocatellia bacterium]|nr:hypothetical protein [Blastocatellia bacterium]
MRTTFVRNFVLSVTLILMVVTTALAQQQTAPSVPQTATPQSRSSVPSLTTADVKKRNPAAVLSVLETAPIPKASPRPRGAENQKDAQFDAAEIAWNEDYRRALARVKDLERRADQAELEAAGARNAIFPGPHDPQELNRLNARVDAQIAVSKSLRAEAERASVELNALLDEARSRGFLVRSYSLFRSNGDPDPDSFRDRYLELLQELHDAEARAAVMDLRTRRIMTNMRIYGCTGVVFPPGAVQPIVPNPGSCTDIYYLNRLRAEFQTAQEELTRAYARIDALKQQIADLQQQGMLAGLPPGLFR